MKAPTRQQKIGINENCRDSYPIKTTKPIIPISSPLNCIQLKENLNHHIEITKANRGAVAFNTESFPAFIERAAQANRKKGKVALKIPKKINGQKWLLKPQKYCFLKNRGANKSEAINKREVTRSIGPITGAAILVNMKEAPHVAPMETIRKRSTKSLLVFIRAPLGGA